jgi:hypothetical protein
LPLSTIDTNEASQHTRVATCPWLNEFATRRPRSTAPSS